MQLPRPLALEPLENRITPANFGIPWPNASQLTLSFAPDGTPDAEQQSQLFRTLNVLGDPKAWQKEILRAFQTWAVQANVNVSVVADSGQAFGSDGAIQGDARFGDIRIGARDLATKGVADSVPFDWMGGTWMGDVNLNTTAKFSLGGQTPGAYDLYTLMLHEAGHSFGVDHSDDPASAMHQNYHGAVKGLVADDVAGIKAIYGARKHDKHEGTAGNNTFASARSIELARSSSSAAANLVNADVTTTADKDFYTFSLSKSAGPVVVELKTSGISSLMGRLTVYNGANQVLASSSAIDPMNGNLKLRFSSLAAGKYYVKVESAAADVFGVGGYQLSARLESVSLPPLLPFTQELLTNTLSNLDLHTNDSFNAATTLTASNSSRDARFNYAYQGSITDPLDVDYYKLTVPTGSGNVLTAVVWGTQLDLVDPTVTVYNAAKQPVAANILVHDSNTYLVQVPNVTPGATYYLAVRGNKLLTNVLGNYYLGVDLSQTVTAVQTGASGTLTKAMPRGVTSMEVSSSSLFHFILSAEGTKGLLSDPAVRMTIYDARGNIVFALQAGVGQTISGNAYLQAGNYRVVFVAANRLLGGLSPTSFKLSYQKIADNIDPYVIDSSSEPTTEASEPTTYEESWYYYYYEEPQPESPPEEPSYQEPQPSEPVAEENYYEENNADGATWGYYYQESQSEGVNDPYSSPYWN